MRITGETGVCAVIGDPIEHSLSPIMHNAAFQHLKLNYVYVAFKVSSGALPDALKGVRSLNIHGINVTMPHKTAIVKYMDEVDATANAIMSVNTILNVEGKLLGFSTDGIGALNALKHNQADPRGKKILILGAGGAARAIAYQLAAEAEEIRILNRTGEKAVKLAEFLNEHFGKKAKGETLTSKTLEKWLRDIHILINATSVGMHSNESRKIVNKEWLRPGIAVMDIVYSPLETALIKDAKAAGAKVIYGTEMLIYQAAASFEIWFRQKAPTEIMRKAVLAELKRREEKSGNVGSSH